MHDFALLWRPQLQAGGSSVSLLCLFPGNDRMLRVPAKTSTEDLPGVHHKKHAVWAHSLHRLGQISLQVRLMILQKRYGTPGCVMTSVFSCLYVAILVSCLERKMPIKRCRRTRQTRRLRVSEDTASQQIHNKLGFCICCFLWWKSGVWKLWLLLSGNPEETAARATASEKDGDIKRISTKEWARSTGYDPVKLFNKVLIRQQCSIVQHYSLLRKWALNRNCVLHKSLI